MSVPGGPSGQRWSLQCDYKEKGEYTRTIESNMCLYQEVHQVRDGVFSVIIKKRENKAEPLKATGVCTRRAIRSAMESSV